MKIKMRLINKYFKASSPYITALILSLSGVLFTSSVKAFAPYYYTPKTEDLKNTSINLGKTAAQLIHYGQGKEALKVAELAIRLNKEDYRLWAVLAEAQVKNNMLDLASQSLREATNLKPNKASLWFAEGSLALHQRKPKKAIYLLNEGLKLKKDHASAYFQIGNARIMQKELSSALKAFKKASNIKTDFWEAINNQGIVLFELGEIETSIKTWRKVLLINENAEPMLALAAALNAINEGNTESIELAKKALNENPNYVSSEYQAEQLWGEKLQKATKQLFKHPNLLRTIKKASANSN